MSRRLLVLALSALNAACFGTPDYEGRLCESGNLCPAGFTCGEDGRCHKATQPIEEDAGTAAQDATGFPDAIDLPDASAPDAQETDGGDPTDGGGPDRSRCDNAVGYPTSGWEARTFSLTANDELETCLGVEDLAGDAIDRNYGGGGPGRDLTDRFGTRYTSRRTFNRGVHTFRVDYDDGIRIFINNVLMFEDWRRGVVIIGEEQLSPYLDGSYELMIEHFENNGSARIKVETIRGCGTIAGPIDGWNIAYYRLNPQSQIELDECLGVQHVNTDQFSMIWTGAPAGISTPGFEDNWAAIVHGRRTLSGLTRFTLEHDDGMRMTIGSVVVYDMLDAGPGMSTNLVHGTGEYAITLELKEFASTAELHVSWINECDQPITPDANSWAVRYYSVIYDGTVNPPVWSLNYDDCRYAELLQTTQVDFDWMGGSPPYLMMTYNLVELWGAELSGPRTFPTNTTVNLRHDDGLRVYLSGNLVYDSWTAPQVIADSISASGSHDVFLQYFENLGGAGLHFNY